MNEKIGNVKDRISEFGRKAKREALDAGSRALEFANRNRELIVIGAPVLIATIKSGQSLVVNRRLRNERSRIDHTYYDPSTGMHWELRRKATNADRAEILRRKKDGQDVYTILRQMKLIK